MDVEMQMEANGLPSQFGSSSERPEESHQTSNLAASISNSENTAAPVTDLKAAVAAQSSFESDPPKSEQYPNGIVSQSVLPSSNGIVNTLPAMDSSVTSVPDSQPQPMSDIETETSLATSAAPALFNSGSSINESTVPSSIPPEVQESQSTSLLSQPVGESVVQSLSVPIQAPTSDLRTTPHSDNLSPSEVAQVEAQKHQEDNAAEPPAPLPFLDAPEPPAAVQSPIERPSEPLPTSAEPISAVPKLQDTGLATPPTHSPPPAPEPKHAELPSPLIEPPPVLPQPSIATDLPAIPQEEPAAPAPTPAAAQTYSEIDADQPMLDIASPPSKVAREREEDDLEAEPFAKRIKTDEVRPESEQPDFKVPEVPATASPARTNGTPGRSTSTPADGDDTVTAPRLAHMKKIISNLKKSNASTPFRLPVDYIALNIPTYPDIVKIPMDLATIDNKLKQNVYTSVSDFAREFELIVANCVAFNGKDHGVSQQAYKMQSSFRNQMQHLPKAGIEEPSKEQKKAARAKQEPTRQAPPRRPSITTTTAPVGSAKSPKAAPPTPSFAPGPDGVPLIRRDSNMADGRPKRAIVPPKRNQEFAGGRPKKKKYELQLRFCQEVLKEITNPKHWQLNQYFTHPVDPVALNIPTYFQIIKKPMDLGTVQTKLDNNVYERAKDFEEDVRLVFRNCYKFNPEGDFVNQCGHQLEDLFNKKWVTKDDWIAAREPPSDPQSDVEDDEEEEEESEEEEVESEDERNEKIIALQKQIEAMSKQMGELTQTKKPKKKSKSPTSAVPKKSKSKNGKKEKSNATFPNLKKQEKQKKGSVSKPKSEKERYVTFAEKQYISNGIAMLPEKQMQEALKIIQQSVPSLANSDQNEIELDIEEVPNHALLKLLNYVKRYAGPPPSEQQAETTSYNAPTSNKSKKNKPMSKQEQEAQIEELKGKLGAYEGPISPNAVESVETGGDSSDDDNSEESEEE